MCRYLLFIPTPLFTQYNNDLGNVSIDSYDSELLDTTLLVPIRHPGSLKYDSILQQLKTQEIFLVVCCSLVLEGIVRQRLNNGGTKPQDRADLLNRLQDIYQEYNQYLDNNPLGRRLHETKQTLSDVENQIQSERVNAAKRRREDQGVTIRVQSQRRSQRLTNTFPGAPHSQDRINKLNQLRTLEDSRLARGLVYSIAPCPPGIDLFSDAYREWFLHAKSGKDMQYSANAFGNDPTRDLDEEGRDDYLKKRKLGIYGAHANVERNQMARQKVALVDLTTESRWNKTGDRGLTIATCIFCGRSLYKTKNTMHRCPELEQEVLTSENNGLSYAYAFYAHDMSDANMPLNLILKIVNKFQ
ncbi:hypothetical protein INT45_005140 [Circinella minor]|uniref:Uncharacterized protein n=1 Tax=Circinella minor TaxID=1195481 RepID=A0A8H7VAJ3_9FUNG|nr:hypothetical protein INT45_005140 [Circinella minor]